MEAAVAAVKDMKMEGAEEDSEPSETSGDSAETSPKAGISSEPAPTDATGDEKKLTDKIAELARRDRDLRARETAVKSQAKAVQEFAGFAEKLKTDPMGALLGVMEKAGVDNSVLLDQLSNITGDEKLKQATRDPEIEELKRWKKEEEQRRQSESQRQAYTAELRNIHQEVQKHPDRWEAILERVDEGALDAVFKTVDAMYRQTGEMPTADTYAEAADAVEKVYRQEEAKELERLTKAKRHAKVSTEGDKKLKSIPAAAAAGSPKQTLTSELQREAPQRKAPKTEAERLALALEQAKQFKWTEDD